MRPVQIRPLAIVISSLSGPSGKHKHRNSVIEGARELCIAKVALRCAISSLNVIGQKPNNINPFPAGDASRRPASSCENSGCRSDHWFAMLYEPNKRARIPWRL